MSRDPVPALAAHLHRRLPQTEDDLGPRLSHVVRTSAAVLGVDGAALMMFDRAGALRLVGSSDAALGMEGRTESGLADGPGADAVRTAGAIGVDDVGRSQRWPGFAASLAGLPVRAVLSVPLWVSDEVVGTFHLVRSVPHVWTAAEIGSADGYAALVAAMLQVAVRAQPDETALDRLSTLLLGADEAAPADPAPEER